MTSYLRYKKELRTVQDADDIESWITVRGNHIPIKKGQSKEEAVKSFLKNKGGSSSTKTESKPKSSSKTTFYKNISGKELWSPAWKGSGRKSGYTAVENQLLTEKEMEKHGFNKESSAFKKIELGKKDHHYMFGARFETKKNEKPESSEKWGGAWSKRANKPESLGNAAKKATETSKKQAEKNFKPTEIPVNKLKEGDVVKHDGELYRVYETNKNQVKLESKESTLFVPKDDKTGTYSSVSPKQKEKLEKVLNKLNSKEEENYKKWTEKKPELNVKKLMKGDLEEFEKFNSWEKSAGAMKYEKQRDFIHKIFGSQKNYWAALHNYDISRKERSKSNSNYLDDDIAGGLIEIAYNDTKFSNNANNNRSALLKAIKESKHENSAEMTKLVKNIPEEKIKNIGAFLRYIENATEGKK